MTACINWYWPIHNARGFKESQTVYIEYGTGFIFYLHCSSTRVNMGDKREVGRPQTGLTPQ